MHYLDSYPPCCFIHYLYCSDSVMSSVNYALPSNTSDNHISVMTVVPSKHLKTPSLKSSLTSSLIDASRKKRQVLSSPGRSVFGDISNHYAEVIPDNVKLKKAHIDFSILDNFKFGHPFYTWDGNRAHEPMLFYPPAFICDPMPPLPAPHLPASPLKLPSVNVKTILESDETSSSRVLQVRLRSGIHSSLNNDYAYPTFLTHHHSRLQYVRILDAAFHHRSRLQ